MDMHVILDIDQTMIDSMSLWEYNRNKNNLRKPDYSFNDVVVWERPHLKQFLNYLNKNIRYISIWTNGTEPWLNLVVNNIISKYIPKKRLFLLMSIDYSTPYNINNTQIFVKQVPPILKRNSQYNVSLKNTVLVDDNYYNCSYNKYNSIPVKKFFAMEEKNRKNNELLCVIDIINTLKNSQDVNLTLKNVYDRIPEYDKLLTNLY